MSLSRVEARERSAHRHPGGSIMASWVRGY
jgi:hypothetical protein